MIPCNPQVGCFLSSVFCLQGHCAPQASWHKSMKSKPWVVPGAPEALTPACLTPFIHHHPPHSPFQPFSLQWLHSLVLILKCLPLPASSPQSSPLNSLCCLSGLDRVFFPHIRVAQAYFLHSWPRTLLLLSMSLTGFVFVSFSLVPFPPFTRIWGSRRPESSVVFIVTPHHTIISLERIEWKNKWTENNSLLYQTLDPSLVRLYLSPSFKTLFPQRTPPTQFNKHPILSVGLSISDRAPHGPPSPMWYLANLAWLQQESC